MSLVDKHTTTFGASLHQRQGYRIAVTGHQHLGDSTTEAFVVRALTTLLTSWLVDSCNLLVAVWNGLPAVGLGGTGDVVAYAQQQGRPIVHIHTYAHTVHQLHSSEQSS